MRQGRTTLLDQMDYFVRHDNEVFLAEGKLPQPSAADQQDLTKEELLKKEVQVVYRPKKDPRDIKILDPACGSGHFLLYAFDLLESVYEEAWSDEQSPRSEVTNTRLADDFGTLAALRQAVPGMILRHNLYGVDIDRRACQIAALALWLRAQRRFKDLGLKSTDPNRRITKTNIVCAEPMPGERELLEDLTAPMDPPILRQLMVAIFDAMKLAGEAGSLLKIEEEIRGPLAQARKAWQSQSETARDRKGHKLLFTVGQVDELTQNQQPMLDLTGITDDEFWNTAEPKLLAELEQYVAKATKGHNIQRSLFAEDAKQGFAFVDLCRQRYDVVLMNPPFGDASLPSKVYIDEHYEDTKKDVYKAFVEAFQDRLIPNGLLGIISNRSGFFKRDSVDWRDHVVLRCYRPVTIADLGYFVLDAKVETAAYVLRALREDERSQLTVALIPHIRTLAAETGKPFSAARYRDLRKLKPRHANLELDSLIDKNFLRIVDGHHRRYELISAVVDAAPPLADPLFPPMICFRLLMERDDKDLALSECIHNMMDHRTFIIEPKRFASLPNHSIAYWLNNSFRSAFLNFPAFEGDERTVKQGLATADDFRFVRAWWEIDANDACPPRVHPESYSGPYCVVGHFRWFPFSKGGKYSPYYGEIPHVVQWARHGVEMKAHIVQRYPYLDGKWGWVVKNVAYYFRPGLTYLSRTTVRTCAMPLPAGSIFGHTGPGVFAPPNVLPQALARFSSYVGDGFLSVSHGQGVEPMSHRKQYEVGIMQRMPWSDKHEPTLVDLVRQAHRCIMKIRASEETSRFFSGSKTDCHVQLDQAVDLLWQIDEIVAAEFGVDVHDLLMKGTEKSAKKQAADQDMRKALRLAGGFSDKKAAVHNQISYAVGVALGRWDVRFGLGKLTPPEPPDPFAPFPVCSPGMLTGSDGLPALSVPDYYPFAEIAWNGILVDDPGLDGDHAKPNDIVRSVRAVWQLLHGAEAERIEQEICDTLKVTNLREYFRSTTAFFERHRKSYRKGGRDAPIYWPLATKSGSYTLWIYYPRLTDQTLYTAVNEYVNPKIEEVNRRIVQIEEDLANKSGRETVELRAELEKCQSLVGELEKFRDELLRVAGLPYKPDLNDGVPICAAPLWQLIPHAAWANILKDTWDDLSDGAYEWAHLAYSIWPDRVRSVAETDLAIAIAHGLVSGDELYHLELADDSMAEADGLVDDLGDDEEGDEDDEGDEDK